MKQRNKLLCLLIGAIIATAGCSTKNETVKSKVNEISVNDLEKVEQIIDIRSEDKYIGWKNENGISGHINKAIDFPVKWLEYEKDKNHIDIELKRRNIDKNKKTVLYSDNDISKEDIEKYTRQGFKDISVLKGGINEYAKSNKSLEKLQGHDKYVSPQWVEDLNAGKKVEGFDGGKYKIIEMSLGSEKDEYTKGHIKNAINLKTDEINHIPGPRKIQDYENIPHEKQLKLWGLPENDKIKKVLEENGIDKNTTVILYGTDKATTGANRTALVLEYAGVKNIKFINGGKKLWKLEGRKLVTDVPKAEKVDFGANIPQNPNVVISYEEESKLINDSSAVIASVRSFDEYLCNKSGYTYIENAGDIENSRFAYAGSDPYAMEDYRNIDNTMFNYKIIEERWKLWGITSDKKVSFHCGTGWRAAETYYIAKALGWKDTGVYVGGWYEWNKRKDTRIKPKGLPSDAPEQKPQEYFY